MKEFFLYPIDSGRMPFGSLNATIPIPETMATTENPPEHFSYIAFRALITCDFVSFLKFVLYNSYAKRFNRASESELVLN